MTPKLLLHTCCGPCAIYVIEELLKQYQVTVYFYNPNIHPRKEYLARKVEVKKYLEKIDVEFIEGDYNTKDWFEQIKGLEHEPEKGRRCDVCFNLRLGEVVRRAKDNGFAAWATTLSISPHKDYKKISEIGQALSKKHDIEFVDRDWKKQEGYKISCNMSKVEGFYRQDYCGCVYSKRDRDEA
ncbi:epoxyqueuosine reductase QueH [Candidatus Parcubacteria bacterium]|jgi:predicted adenine nucleotide alpha hydrolase (AANH) superfamily ATPase|nr:epoxyqueuosine reductase QueH [Candidatus Parcubacteria bacterium]